MKQNTSLNVGLVEDAKRAMQSHQTYGQYKAGIIPDTEKDTTAKVNFWWKKSGNSSATE